MKKLSFIGLFLLLIVPFLPRLVSADVIPENYHPVDRCVKIINLDKYSDISVLSLAKGPMLAPGGEISVIKNNECIKGGYKFNNVNLYWTTNDKLNSVEESKLLINNIGWAGGVVGDGNSLIKETVEYSIYKNNDKFNLFKTKIISEYNDGKSAKVQNFSLPGFEKQKEVKKAEVSNENIVDNSQNIDYNQKQTPVKKGFWKKVVCFFGFSKNC